MTVAGHQVLHNWNHEDPADAAAEILEAIGDISGLDLAGHQVLVASYCRPARTRGGLHIPGSAQNEDVYQGTVGLILAMGPLAFGQMEKEWGGVPPAVCQWVYFRPQDSVMCSIKGPGARMRSDGGKRVRDWEGWQCRLVFARDIYMRVKLPHVII